MQFSFSSSILLITLGSIMPFRSVLAEMQKKCFTGYVMDTYCVERGTFLDKPNVTSLDHPEQHTALCLIDPPECIDNGYEILGPPSSADGNYTRVAKFDETGNQMFVALAKKLGSGCSGCEGSQTEGLQATVVGYVMEADLPMINVTNVFPNTTSCDEALNADMSPNGSSGITAHSSSVGIWKTTLLAVTAFLLVFRVE